MKFNFSDILRYFLMVIFVTMTTILAQAQEESPITSDTREVNNHTDLNINEDKPVLIIEPESKLPSSGATVKENHNLPLVKPAKNKNTDNPKAIGEKESDDALSFNFLYYIIQTFKFSDLVDD